MREMREAKRRGDEEQKSGKEEKTMKHIGNIKKEQIKYTGLNVMCFKKENKN